MKPTPTHDLRPCPFCGGPSHSTPEIPAANMAALIMCSDNDCVTLAAPTLFEAVETWNRRAALSVPAAAVVGEPVGYVHDIDGPLPVFSKEAPTDRTWLTIGADATPVYAAPSAPDGWQPSGLSKWAGWDQSNLPWSEAKHKDRVCYAAFGETWSMEDAHALISFIDRTWGGASHE